jgi:hypothetical protein
MGHEDLGQAREKKAKDNGILLHAYGPHGAYSDTWMASIEAQIIEGGVGDILVLSPEARRWHGAHDLALRRVHTRPRQGENLESKAPHARP